MAKCKECEDGSIECGPVESELCAGGGSGFRFAGVFALKLFVRQGATACRIRVVPCLPTGEFDCRELMCGPARAVAKGTRKRVRKAAKKAIKKAAGK
jgi:hypothetical protein